METFSGFATSSVDKFDFTMEAYDTLNVFPPLIAHQILAAFIHPLHSEQRPYVNRVGMIHNEDSF